MIKVQVLSDIHFEFHKDSGKSFYETLEPDCCDVLVLAGDICPVVHPKYKWFLEHFGEIGYKKIIYVPGNHEYYGSNYTQAVRIMRETWQNHPIITFLSGGNSCKINEFTFIGGTLWYPNNKATAERAKQFSDFYQIKQHTSYGAENEQICNMIDGFSAFHSNIIVVTHHAPSFQSVAPQYMGDPFNIYFANDLDAQIMKWKPILWIHGHMHTPFDYKIGETRVVANPHGYPHEVTQYKENLVIEVFPT